MSRRSGRRRRRRRAETASVLEARGERAEELVVFLLGADGDAQVLGQTVAAADRPHDDAAAQEALVDLGGLAHTHGDEIAERRNEVEVEGTRALLDLAHALQVLGVAARNKL